VGTRKRFDKVLVVTEGKTEELYLDCFKWRFRYEALDIENSSETSPGQLLESAITFWRKSKSQSKKAKDSSYFSLPYDSVWIAFDRNGNTLEQIDSTTREAQRQNINVAFSQPCFEIWLLLHFAYSTREFDACKEVMAALKQHDKTYSKTGNFEEYMPKIKTAIDNSKKLHHFAIDHGSKSHTTFHKLIEELLAQIQKKKGH
jgi:hypothetical protein